MGCSSSKEESVPVLQEVAPVITTHEIPQIIIPLKDEDLVTFGGGTSDTKHNSTEAEIRKNKRKKKEEIIKTQNKIDDEKEWKEIIQKLQPTLFSPDNRKIKADVFLYNRLSNSERQRRKWRRFAIISVAGNTALSLLIILIL